jgi:hypothetical protein
MEWIIARVSSFSIMPSIDWSSVAFRLRGFRCPLQRAYGCFRICRLLGMRSKLECIFEIGLAPAERHAVAGVLTRWAVHVFLGVSTNCLSLDVLRLYFFSPRVSSRRCGLRLLQWLLLEDLSVEQQQQQDDNNEKARRRSRRPAKKFKALSSLLLQRAAAAAAAASESRCLLVVRRRPAVG